MNAPLFGSSRPNISVRVLPKIPATMVGAGGIGISKVNGKWTIEPSWGDLQLIAPGVLLDPTTKEIWVHDPVTDIYNRMTLGGLGQALFWGTSSTVNTIAASAFPGTARTFQTQSGKDWAIGSYLQAVSQGVPADNMIGQVASYVGTTLTVNMLTANGVGNSHADWLLVPSTLPGAGTPGATGASSGLNYNYVFTDTNMGTSPGSGNIKFNSTTVASINQVSVHHSDRNALNLSAEVTTWSASTTVNNNARLRIYSPSDPTKFIIATVAGDEVNVVSGSTGYSTFTLSNPTGPGCGANMAVQVEILRTGDKGVDGTNGTNGATGSPGADGTGTGYRYQWSTSTAGDPGSGKIAVNNAAIGSATGVQISETTRIPQSIAAYLNTVWTSSNSNKGTIYIVSVPTPTTFALYTITGGADAGAYDTLTVTTAASSGSFAANEEVQVFFSRAGDAGSGSVSGGTANYVALFGGSTSITAGVSLTADQLLYGQAGAPIAVTPSGDVTVGSAPSAGTFTIGAAKVTYAKIQNAGASSKLLGSGASGAGSSLTEITLGTGLSMTTTTLNAAVSAITMAQETADTTCFPAFFTDSAASSLQPKVNTSLTYNANTGDFSIGTSAKMTVGTLDIGSADTTLSRSAAGQVAAEGINILQPNFTNLISKGYTLTPNGIGTMAATFTPDPTAGNYQFATNNNAVTTFNVPGSDCAIDILITNGASAGAITFSGSYRVGTTGDAYNTTNTNVFLLSIRRINAISTYIWKALQ